MQPGVAFSSCSELAARLYSTHSHAGCRSHAGRKGKERMKEGRARAPLRSIYT